MIKYGLSQECKDGLNSENWSISINGLRKNGIGAEKLFDKR